MTSSALCLTSSGAANTSASTVSTASVSPVPPLERKPNWKMEKKARLLQLLQICIGLLIVYRSVTSSSFLNLDLIKNQGPTVFQVVTQKIYSSSSIGRLEIPAPTPASTLPPTKAGGITTGTQVDTPESKAQTTNFTNKDTFISSNTAESAVSLETKKEFLLKVPFFMYDGPLDQSTVSIYRKSQKMNITEAYTPTEAKHSDDWWHYQAAKVHPMRVNDPSQAKLFFVPSMINSVNSNMYIHNKICIEKSCGRKVIQHAADLLANSEWFQRNHGRDHVVVDSHYRDSIPVGSSLYFCNRIDFENHKHHNANATRDWLKTSQRLRIPSMYVGAGGCPIATEKTADFVFVGKMKPSTARFRPRSNVCDWIKHANKQASKEAGRRVQKYTAIHCGSNYPRCPALADAKYSFHIRGDTWGSNRLLDILLSKTVPIFTHEMQYEVLPDFIPWKEIGYFVPAQRSKEEFYAAMDAILSKDEAEYQTKLDLIDQYYHLFDHTQPYQFDAYMYQFAKKLGYQ